MSKAFFFMNDDIKPLESRDCREAWMPRSGDGYYDTSARKYFNTKREKRAWLRANGMREAGLYSKRDLEQ